MVDSNLAPFVADLVQSLARIPWNEWLLAAGGIMAGVLGPVLRPWFPAWGTGRLLVTVPIARPIPISLVIVGRLSVLYPLVLGSGSLLHNRSHWFSAFFLGLGVVLLVSAVRRFPRDRREVRFFENRIGVGGKLYPFSTIREIERTDQGGRRIVWRRLSFDLTADQWSVIESDIHRVGYGADQVHKSDLTLK